MEWYTLVLYSQTITKQDICTQKHIVFVLEKGYRQHYMPLHVIFINPLGPPNIFTYEREVDGLEEVIKTNSSSFSQFHFNSFFLWKEMVHQTLNKNAPKTSINLFLLKLFC